MVPFCSFHLLGQAGSQLGLLSFLLTAAMHTADLPQAGRVGVGLHLSWAPGTMETGEKGMEVSLAVHGRRK